MHQVAIQSPHTQTIPTGPAGSEKETVDAIEGTSPMILNAIANTCGVEYWRFSSCLYPIRAKPVSARPTQSPSGTHLVASNPRDPLDPARRARPPGLQTYRHASQC